ncbi:MAG TPA: glycosyltransferase family 39 protein [Candidatus Cybelea sp.]|nr:glycosyltransferase family 39 protein [Candidatus Cybelea sp.]
MNKAWIAGLLGVLTIALALRLYAIGNPIVDHPGWRQGDTAAIARNFAERKFDILYPQTTYNGPPPNYVELELQIVPFLAASLDKVFGVHEIFGRLIAVAFSLGTVGVLAVFARWLFGSALAGLIASFFYAIFPGSVYYGRTFMPDCAMVFFLTAALYAAARLLLDRERLAARAVAGVTALLTLAYLAKPVALLGLAPLCGLLWDRVRARKAMVPIATAILVLLPVLLVWLYDRRVASYAEWHWASGITKLHVLPSLQGAFGSLAAFGAKCTQFRMALGMLRETMLGRISFLLAIAAFVALPWITTRSKTLLWAWLAGGLAYVFVVVTVERVDYYLYPLLPLCALAIGGLLARFLALVRGVDAAPAARYALVALVPLAALAALLTSRAPVAAYYAYNGQAYRDAVELDRTLPPGALVVIAHYGADLQYYIDRFGWEEDPLLWTPFDEESAIAKGARYFIAVEDHRLRHNLELCAWLQRFPVTTTPGGWPVYQTSPGAPSASATRFWRDFRTAERNGSGRAFLDSRGVCKISRV